MHGFTSSSVLYEQSDIWPLNFIFVTVACFDWVLLCKQGPASDTAYVTILFAFSSSCTASAPLERE